MDYAAVDAGLDPTRHELLALASAVRSGLERIEAERSAAGVEGLTAASAALSGLASRLAHPPLQRWSMALSRLTSVATSLLAHEPPAALEMLGGLHDVVGGLERGLDCHLDGRHDSGLAALEASWRRCIPAAWESWLDSDEASFRARLTTLQPRGREAPARPHHELPLASEEELFQRELREAFLTEVSEGLERCEELLVRFEKRPDDDETLHALFRQYHTLKGAAAAVELTAVAEQLHRVESLLQALRDGEVDVDRTALVDLLLRVGDSVKALLDQSCGRQPASSIIANLDSEITRLLQGEGTSARAPEPRAPFAGSQAPATDSAVGEADAAFDPLPALNTLRQKAARGQLDPELLLVIDALDQRARHFSQMAATLQEEVKSLRTVPLDDVFRRLQRPVRDAARQEGKFVDLVTTGGELRIDRSVAERLSAPLMHLLRNAVAHGIEAPAQREARGKPRTGSVRVNASQHSGALEVTVSDDGNGIDFAAVRNKASALGWLGAMTSPEELAQMIFRPGFSTRDEVDELAGRGVGMDVVAREIESLKGRVTVNSSEGKGTTFRISVPHGGSGGSL